jgi:hypothetical protein
VASRPSQFAIFVVHWNMRDGGEKTNPSPKRGLLDSKEIERPGYSQESEHFDAIGLVV